MIEYNFQQVVCVTRKKVCGLEGLIRGVDAGRVVSPYALFWAAQKKGLTLELDRLCRDKVFKGALCEPAASGEPGGKLPQIVSGHEAVECAYVLDEQGIQFLVHHCLCFFLCPMIIFMVFQKKKAKKWLKN